ncbi:ribokinase [Nitrobacteraceae bacterium AZCC 2161]|jgi:ribokinase
MAKIWVIGSANADLMLALPVLPRPGETVRGRDFVVAPGGKGANQAVAAARLGGDVSFVGCIGDDAFGISLRTSLSDSGVDVTHLKVAAGVTSGIAMVMTEASGENSIAISGGANDLLLPEDIDALSANIGRASLLVCQFESPAETVERALALAKLHSIPVLLNPAPARPVDDALLDGLRFLIPNRHELASLTGREINSPEDIAAATKLLLKRGVQTVIVTLGRDGVALVDSSGIRTSRAAAVDAVDTTGAGDTFVGAFAVEWCRTADVNAAIAFAQRAAAFSVTSCGAQASMPWFSDLDSSA